MKKYFFFFAFSLYCFMAFSQAGWHAIDAPLDGNDHGAVFTIDENVVHMVLDNGRLLKTEDGGENWTTFETGVQEHFFDLVFYGENLGLAVGANGSMLKTTNGGTTWTSINSGTSNHLFSLDFRSETEVWAVGANGTVLKSTNSGASWDSVNVLPSGNLYSIRFKDSEIGLIAGADGYLIKTLDGAENWEIIDIDATIDLFSISITENNFIVRLGFVTYGYHLEFSENQHYISSNLIDWEHIFNEEIPYSPSKIYFYDDTSGFALWSEATLGNECYLQIYKSEDLGENWDLRLDITTNAANCIHSGYYSDMHFVNPYVGYVLYGEKLFKTTDGGTYTSVEDFGLEKEISVYPNPSDDVIHISVSDITKDIQIKIFDVSGKEVLMAEIIKNDTSIDASSLKAGIYFVKIQSKTGLTEIKKFIKK